MNFAYFSKPQANITSEKTLAKHRDTTPLVKMFLITFTSDPELVFQNLIELSVPPVANRSIPLKSAQRILF